MLPLADTCLEVASGVAVDDVSSKPASLNASANVTSSTFWTCLTSRSTLDLPPAPLGTNIATSSVAPDAEVETDKISEAAEFSYLEATS